MNLLWANEMIEFSVSTFGVIVRVSIATSWWF